jgi:hypothetical protein
MSFRRCRWSEARKNLRRRRATDPPLNFFLSLKRRGGAPE